MSQDNGPGDEREPGQPGNELPAARSSEPGFSELAGAQDDLLAAELATITRRQDSGEISVAQAAAERIAALTAHLEAMRALRQRFFPPAECAAPGGQPRHKILITRMDADRPGLYSEDVVISAPLSFTGSAHRLWFLTRDRAGWGRAGMTALALALVTLAWCVVLAWYLIFGYLVIPYRIIRRNQRKRKIMWLRHRELVSTLGMARD